MLSFCFWDNLYYVCRKTAVDVSLLRHRFWTITSGQSIATCHTELINGNDNADGAGDDNNNTVDGEGDKADDWVIGLHPLDSQSSLAASPLHCQCHHQRWPGVSVTNQRNPQIREAKINIRSIEIV